MFMNLLDDPLFRELETLRLLLCLDFMAELLSYKFYTNYVCESVYATTELMWNKPWMSYCSYADYIKPPE